MNDKILVLVAHPSMEQSRLNRRLMRAAAAAAASPPVRGRIEVRDLYALYPGLPDRRRRRAARAGVGPADHLAAPDALVRHAAVDEAVARHRTRLRLGLWPGRQRPARQGPVAGAEHRQLRVLVSARGSQPLLPRRVHAAVRADGGAVRAALPAAAGAALPRTSSTTPELDRLAQQFAQLLERYPDWPELQELDACVDCPTPADARPAATPAGQRMPLPFARNPTVRDETGVT